MARNNLSGGLRAAGPAAGTLLGSYMYRVFEGKSRWLAPVERATLACCGTDGREQDWKSYALSLLAFNGAGFGLLFLILMAQGLLPSTRNSCRA